MENKKEVKKVMFIEVERDSNGEVIMIAYKKKNMGGIRVVDVNNGKDINGYVYVSTEIKDPSVQKIAAGISVIEGLEKLMDTHLQKEEWVDILAYAKKVGVKKSDKLESVIKELGLEQAEIKENPRLNLENKMKIILSVYAKLLDKYKKLAEKKAIENEWKKKLSYEEKVDKNGKKYKQLHNTLKNTLIIMENDPKLKTIAYNTMADRIEINGDLKSFAWEKDNKRWRNADFARLETYIDSKYGKISKNYLETAFTTATDRRKFNPVKEYLEQVEPTWDGKDRAEMWIIRHLGAEDCLYVREVSKKTLMAAVARVYNPGEKFHTMLVLDRPQGNGKSTMLEKLGREWYTDSVNLGEVRDKTAAEKLQGNWIVEIGEMAGMRKADIETLKAFLSRRDDEYRPPYGRVVEQHPRQCVLIGTTNSEERGFLRDPTGNRRYWPVETAFMPKEESSWNVKDAEVDQIWAETVHLYKANKNKRGYLILSAEAEEHADKVRQGALETGTDNGQIEQYLGILLPKSWDSKSITERQKFIEANVNGRTEKQYIGTEKRNSVCVREIWHECFGEEYKNGNKMKRTDSDEICHTLRKLGWLDDGTKNFARYGKQKMFSKKE